MNAVMSCKKLWSLQFETACGCARVIQWRGDKPLDTFYLPMSPHEPKDIYENPENLTIVVKKRAFYLEKTDNDCDFGSIAYYKELA